MPAATYALTFDGYWREPNVGGLPAASGIYCVYACRHNVAEGTVTIRRLLYIGEAGNVRDRVFGHECWSEWRNYLLPYEELCVSAALIAPAADRCRAEAAMINHHRPRLNTEYSFTFSFDETTILSGGSAALLTLCFTVQPSGLGSLAALLGVTTRR